MDKSEWNSTLQIENDELKAKVEELEDELCYFRQKEEFEEFRRRY